MASYNSNFINNIRRKNKDLLILFFHVNVRRNSKGVIISIFPFVIYGENLEESLEYENPKVIGDKWYFETLYKEKRIT